MANPERYDQNGSKGFRAQRALIQLNKEEAGKENREFSKERPIYEVKSGGSTIEWTPLVSKAEEAIRKANGALVVYVHNQQRGHKKPVMERRALFSTFSQTSRDNIAAQAITDFRHILGEKQW